MRVPDYYQITVLHLTYNSHMKTYGDNERNMLAPLTKAHINITEGGGATLGSDMTLHLVGVFVIV